MKFLEPQIEVRSRCFNPRFLNQNPIILFFPPLFQTRSETLPFGIKFKDASFHCSIDLLQFYLSQWFLFIPHGSPVRFVQNAFATQKIESMHIYSCLPLTQVFIVTPRQKEITNSSTASFFFLHSFFITFYIRLCGVFICLLNC